MSLWLTIECDEQNVFACVVPTSPVHYPGKSSVSKVFSALFLTLAYGYEVMSQLVRACMPCYCKPCGTALSYPTAPFAPCTPYHTSKTKSRKHVCVFSKYTDHDFERAKLKD